MAIVYTDPEIILARYQAGEPVVDDYQADVIEGLHFLWRRHAQLILAYVPRVRFENTSASFNRVNENAADYAEDLNIYPLGTEFRPNVGGNVALTVSVAGVLIEVDAEVYDSSGLLDTANIVIGAAPAIGSDVVSVTPAGPMWILLKARRNGVSGTGAINALYIYSSYAEGAPK
jgi:hypothetical protein